MKLRVKILRKYLEQILKGEKKVEYRKVESIIFVDEKGNEYEFEVKGINAACKGYSNWSEDYIELLRKIYPDISWNDNLPLLEIKLGRRIK